MSPKRTRPPGGRLKDPASSVFLREYRPADLPKLHQIDQACFPAGIAYSKGELRRFLEHPSSLSAIAVEGSSIAGFMILRPHRSRTGSALHLLTIDVAPGARRQGIGRSLMTWALGERERLGSQSITLEVAVNNESAQAFYLGLGFVGRATIPGYYPGGLDALRMELSRTNSR